MKKIGWRRIRHLVKDSIGMGLSSIIGQAKLLDVNFLSAMIGSLASVPFVVVTRLTGSLGIFSNAFSQAISPTLAKNEITKEDKRDLQRSAIWLFFAIFSAALVFVNASAIVDIVLGDKYRSSVPIVKILAITSIFSTLAQPLTVLVQNQANPFKVTFSLFSGFLVQVGFIYLFKLSIINLSL
jgi:O-antigen/teichoic acid export membrane protein